MDLLSKLAAIKQRWEEIAEELNKPETILDQKRYIRLNKEYSELSEIVEVYHEYRDLMSNIEENKNIIHTDKDPELRELAKADLEELLARKEPLEEKIKLMLIPPDPADNKNAIVEIRAGTGGDEASIFAGDLFKMYEKYAAAKGWKIEVVDFNPGSTGGFKEIIFEVSGQKVYGTLKYESGVHRVQRVPITETQGRIHTSAASVVVLPEADDFDIELKESDIRKDTFCSSGPGGQSVNTTYSAVRLTHIPTGIVATCQDQKSQIKNLEKAMKVLKTRIYELEYQKYLDDVAKKRKTMVSTGDRSAKIRTYNYPQGRITDHRIGFSIFNLPDFMNGNIEEMIEALQVAENAEKLKEGVLFED
ncbi:MAG TPA: peptide chain release factor 1 [Bacteroidia bacterium]|nr:peptide chain release factor 1 [Sphingobacteriales bacterium]HPD64731.1 peptide chain release factor 1 [Bacteroidia bacterium]HRS59311.1 peptide chain release factor 1 [Bacteroidia bacterium]HRU68251.1 peptide chain release factor 1 [Bacteroidia bacterium]